MYSSLVQPFSPTAAVSAVSINHETVVAVVAVVAVGPPTALRGFCAEAAYITLTTQTTQLVCPHWLELCHSLLIGDPKEFAGGSLHRIIRLPLWPIVQQYR